MHLLKTFDNKIIYRYKFIISKLILFGCFCTTFMGWIILYWGKNLDNIDYCLVWHKDVSFFITILFYHQTLLFLGVHAKPQIYWDHFFHIWLYDALIGSSLNRQCINIIIMYKLYLDWWKWNIFGYNIKCSHLKLLCTFAHLCERTPPQPLRIDFFGI